MNLYFEAAALALSLKNANATSEKIAERAIKAFKERGGVDFVFDPSNKEQLCTYMQLKQVSTRVTPQALAKALTTQKTDVVQGGAMRFSYWGVPKNNFPKGLPAKLQQSELPEHEANDYMIMGGASIDLDLYYIVDCEVQRSELGKNVVTFEFVSKKMTKRKHNSDNPAAVPMIKDKDDKDEKEEKEESKGAASAADRTHLGRKAAGACEDEKNKKRTQLGLHSSDASDTADDPNPPEKQAKTMLSTMKYLKDSLQQAMDQDMWEASSALHQDNVKYLLDELIAVLVDMKAIKPAAEISTLALKVARWLINQILDRPVFAHLHIFKHCAIKKLLEGELAEGIDSTSKDHFCTDMVKLIESLAGTSSTDTNAMPNLGLATVTHRTTFRASSLYRSFVNAKVDAVLSKAKAASGSARVNFVKDCQHVVGLPPAVQFTIDVVLAVFDEVIPLENRIGYILGQADDTLRGQVLKLAIDWDPHGAVGMGAMCLEEKADLSGKPYLIFAEFADAAIKTVGGNMMCALFVLKRYRR